MNNKLILVIGATGQQGGAAARHLLDAGWTVRALVRDPEKDTARALEKQGAELVQGDLYDRQSLDAALETMYGVFGFTNFWLPDVGYEGEIKQGKLLADVAKKAEIQHFVYSSVGAAHRGMGQKHFESKWIVEQYIEEVGVPHTILRPAAFMDNLGWKRAQISNGVLESWGIRQDKSSQLIAADDIGAIAAIVFSDPGQYLGTTLEIAGDELTEAEQAETFSKVIGRPVKVELARTTDGDEPDKEQLAGTRFFNGEAYTADIAAIRKIHPGLHTLEQYLSQSGWEDLPVLPMPEGNDAWDG